MWLQCCVNSDVLVNYTSIERGTTWLDAYKDEEVIVSKDNVD